MSAIENIAHMLAKDTLVWEREFDIDQETLWNAIATREGLSHWFMPTKFGIEPGGPFSFEGGWDGTITRIEPPGLIQFNPQADSEDAWLRFKIEATSSGSLFKLTDRMGSTVDPLKIFSDDTPEFLIYQPGGIGTHWSGVAAGYHGFVNALETHITGREIPFDCNDMSKQYAAAMDEWHVR